MTTTSAPPEERMVLRGVRWETYARLLDDHADQRSPRFTYDRGVLEIMSPGSRHETLAELVSLLVAIVAEVRGVDLALLGSTTFKDPDWERGFEPDACFYLQQAAQMRGKERIDPRVDPAPEVVFEVDITPLQYRQAVAVRAVRRSRGVASRR